MPPAVWKMLPYHKSGKRLKSEKAYLPDLFPVQADPMHLPQWVKLALAKETAEEVWG